MNGYLNSLLFYCRLVTVTRPSGLIHANKSSNRTLFKTGRPCVYGQVNTGQWLLNTSRFTSHCFPLAHYSFIFLSNSTESQSRHTRGSLAADACSPACTRVLNRCPTRMQRAEHLCHMRVTRVLQGEWTSRQLGTRILTNNCINVRFV